MTIRAREAVVADFLRKALAAKAVGVAELDMMARAAGLLREHQRITDAKVFRRGNTICPQRLRAKRRMGVGVTAQS
jgi:hypothetical protein